ncbi:MAG TPA: hypothetical protein V6C97_24125 [Oculatellaceae cyanobacterium]
MLNVSLKAVVRCSVLFLAFFGQLNNQAAVAKNLDGWEVEYDSSFAGFVDLKFCDQGLMMKLDKIHLTVLGSAPSWTCFVYNDMSKRYLTMTASQWKDKFAERILKYHSAAPEKTTAVFSQKVETIDGLQASQIFLQRKNAQGDMENTSEVWISKELSAPPQFKELMNLSLDLPKDFIGTPLRVSTIQKAPVGFRSFQVLSAYRVRKINVSADDFKPLSGYKEVKDATSLVIGDHAPQ